MVLPKAVIASAARNASYRLTWIEEEEVPLLRAPKDDFYGMTILVMAVILILLAVAGYILMCEKYRRRIIDLVADKKVYCGWAIWKLRDTVVDLEMQKAEWIVKDIKNNFEKCIEKPTCNNFGSEENIKNVG